MGSEEGTRTLDALAREYDKFMTGVEVPAGVKNDHQAKIWHFLGASNQPTPTLAIAKVLFGSQATAKHVNPDLYAMEKAGLVAKVPPTQPNGGNPHWQRR